jgi:hypothetical protein
MADYSKAVIYTIRSKDSIYVGSTINFISRKNQHKACIYNENSKQYNFKLYKIIRENNYEWSMRPYRAFPCNSKLELTIEEERIRCELNADMNERRCGTCSTKTEYYYKYREEISKRAEQYYQQNKKSINDNVKEYREKNKEKISEQRKQFREKNKEKISEKRKQFREENKDKIKENKKQYYQENKEKLNEKRKEKMTCECGSICRKNDLPRHKRSKKHLDWEKLK